MQVFKTYLEFLQRTLALEVDKNKAHLSRVMSGKMKANLELVQKLATVPDVDVQRLFKP